MSLLLFKKKKQEMEECNIGLKQEEWYWKTCKRTYFRNVIIYKFNLGFWQQSSWYCFL